MLLTGEYQPTSGTGHSHNWEMRPFGPHCLSHLRQADVEHDPVCPVVFILNDKTSQERLELCLCHSQNEPPQSTVNMRSTAVVTVKQRAEMAWV